MAEKSKISPLATNAEKVKIVKAVPTDLNALVALEQLSFQASDYPLSRRQFSHFIHHGHVLFLTIKIQELIIGYALFLLRKNSTAAHLHSLALHPDYHGMGLGKHLMEIAILEIQNQKLQKIRLEVRVDNYAALNFYSKLGFKPIVRCVGFYADGADALKMEYNLTPKHREA
ncbi:MAG TPA: N-acetyltransferase [Gammaproteobacteria bacterium]|nr:N-acetyltransferase [Gammaproteobacteria bacterium]